MARAFKRNTSHGWSGTSSMCSRTTAPVRNWSASSSLDWRCTATGSRGCRTLTAAPSELTTLYAVENRHDVQHRQRAAGLAQMLLDLDLAADVPQRHQVAVGGDHRLCLACSQCR